jgi:phage-related minor tail protein
MRLSVQAEEEARSLQKKIQLIENDLDQTMEQLTQVNAKLDEKAKALENVSFVHVLHMDSLACP